MIAEVLKNNFSPTCYYYYKQNFVFVKGAILKKSEKVWKKNAAGE